MNLSLLQMGSRTKRGKPLQLQPSTKHLPCPSSTGASWSGSEQKGPRQLQALCSLGVFSDISRCDVSESHALCSTNLIPNHSLGSQINQWREMRVGSPFSELSTCVDHVCNHMFRAYQHPQHDLSKNQLRCSVPLFIMTSQLFEMN